MVIEQVAQEQQAQPQLGLSEHDQKMIAVAEGTAPKEEPKEQPKESERPQWLPEKFKTVEDMAKAYSELESKLGKPKEEPEAKPEVKDETQGKTPEEVQAAQQAVLTPDNINKYNSEISTNGTLSEESYTELAKVGLSKDIVDAYISGQQAIAEKTQSELLSVAGGPDNYKIIGEWANTNADKSIVDAYNAALDSNNLAQAKGLLSAIVTQYKQSIGTEGVRVNGSRAEPNVDVFTSWDEVTTAMRDPKYKGKYRDESYVKAIEAKIHRSNL